MPARSELREPAPVDGPPGEVTRGDANALARELQGIDCAYLDPPYNGHSYFSNYHVWETLVRWDRPESYGVARKRVGLKPEGRVPAREGSEIADEAGRPIGKVTSGGFGATVGGPVAMGYVAPAAAKPGTRVTFLVRGEARPGAVAKMPFVPHRYARG